VKPYARLLVIAGVSQLCIIGLTLLTPALLSDLVAKMTGGGQTPRLQEFYDFLARLTGGGVTVGAGLTLQLVYIIAAALLASYLFRVFFSYVASYLSHKASWNLVSDMRVLFYGHLQKLSLRFYHDKQTGQLLSRVINDTAAFENLIAHSLPDIASNVLVAGGVTTILLFINWKLALLTFIPIPFLLAATAIFGHRVLRAFRNAQQTLADLNADLQDNLSGIREIQVFNKERDEREKIGRRSRSFRDAILSALRMSAVFHPSVEFITALGTVIVVLFGGIMALRLQTSAADIVAFLLYLGMFYGPISTLARVVEDVQRSFAGAERVFEVLDTEPDIADLPGAKPLGECRGALEFENVTFRYRDDVPVLENISFSAEPGRMVALVGPTGVGKTTIISLIPRFYDPAEGCVTLDGHDLKTLTLQSLRSNISMVLQDVFLFNGSIADNIAYGSPGATRAQIEEAARAACAHDFIADAPDGYDTVVGERGMLLSGGQKQRIAIARAVLKNSPVLVLDEATASVDTETEAQIQRAIHNLMGTRTIIVIAHRLSTVKRADKIIVLDKGRVVESGKHEELMDNGGLYARLCRTQLDSFDRMPAEEI
jgi:ABC-type multidrug transport system fused ATPase/permease subunit